MLQFSHHWEANHYEEYECAWKLGHPSKPKSVHFWPKADIHLCITTHCGLYIVCMCFFHLGFGMTITAEKISAPNSFNSTFHKMAQSYTVH